MANSAEVACGFIFTAVLGFFFMTVFDRDLLGLCGFSLFKCTRQI
jgi:hypothetical protein